MLKRHIKKLTRSHCSSLANSGEGRGSQRALQPQNEPLGVMVSLQKKSPNIAHLYNVLSHRRSFDSEILKELQEMISKLLKKISMVPKKDFKIMKKDLKNTRKDLIITKIDLKIDTDVGIVKYCSLLQQYFMFYLSNGLSVST